MVECHGLGAYSNKIVFNILTLLNKNAKFWIEKLKLQKHPEGGYFTSTYVSDKKIDLPDYDGFRSTCTSIYYLLAGNQFASFHTIKSDEIWHFYSGSSLTLHMIYSNGEMEQILVGPNYDKGERFQVIIKSGCWFAATINDKKSYSLVGCTVSPGFDYRDWKIGDRRTLLEQYPQYSRLIKKYAAHN
ncbi:MAG TPA: cupin domain-containing protein [Nitrososphaeraceae archaeon]|jgi:predicted cupin superfamily sugar epimerase